MLSIRLQRIGRKKYPVYRMVVQQSHLTPTSGKVVKLMEFGAFVNILPGIDGLVHISNLSLDGQRVERTEDVVKEGQSVKVQILDIDDRSGKISLKLLA